MELVLVESHHLVHIVRSIVSKFVLNFVALQRSESARVWRRDERRLASDVVSAASLQTVVM